ncbi:MAG: hypothetical protein LC104_13685 [Bacteroidales bacterium]|nr:hypothetical protein [Bacteroidales bacterium]
MVGQDQHKSLEEVNNVGVPRWVTPDLIRQTITQPLNQFVDIEAEWVTPDLIRQTITVWEPRYGRPLSTDEAVQIILAAGRLCEVLKP